jgi:hypothetical protein
VDEALAEIVFLLRNTGSGYNQIVPDLKNMDQGRKKYG